ncbi:glycosyltransferase family 2 protein [Brasilonema sp. UFV-L1]|uniref:glycosyltransferase family 2 protein n=1 Tax=Brasilonema sp. UFV-L1 TaxID=2234130 RepID=UPI00145FD1C5|nr:glycosyltransferase family 2 protein [Brasilonema sp. UFV-L1]NMG08967.1 glycosyltransferase family 2 protein [Brasilonema sp. UFV-L1]
MSKVTVIIPAYNAMKYLPETVESVLNQTLTDFEVLIINDGSSDGIVEWASQITDSRVRLISQENQGTAAARNKGIVESKGEYIAFLDADDIWEPTKLEKQAQCLDNNPLVGLVDAWTAFIDENSKPTGIVMTHNSEGDVYKKVVEVCDSTVCCGSSPMIRRSCFDTLGLFDRESYIEDVDMWIRIATCYHYGVVKEVLVKYRQHPSNKSKDCESMLRGFRQLIEKTYRSLPTEILHLRPRSYGRLYVYLAWKSMDTKDYKQGFHYTQQAFALYPQLIFQLWYLRLYVAIAIIRLLGPQKYDQIRSFNHNIRRRLLALTT